MSIEELDTMGCRSRRWRWYLWAVHFLVLGDRRSAGFFVGKLWGIRSNDWDMPLSWQQLSDLTWPDPDRRLATKEPMQ